jgi:hypothetical protein
MNPPRVLLFLLAVMAILAVLGTLVPDEGLRVAGYTLRLPSPRALLFPPAKEDVDISAILALGTDSEEDDEGLGTTATDPLPLVLDLPAELVKALDLEHLPPLLPHQALHFPDRDAQVLDGFFASLDAARERTRPLHVLHYGDSQLEGDRITNYVRHKLQTHFGGRGPGLIALVDIVPHFSVERVLEGDWNRYSAMDRKDSTLRHNRFGVMSAFARFTPILPDSVPPDSNAIATASITVKPHPRSFRRAREWTTCRLFFGWHRAPVRIDVAADGVTVASEVVPAADRLLHRTWDLPATPEALTITFTGSDSPDLHALSLEGRRGVSVDNIAARGAAGYEVNRNDAATLRATYDALDVGLVVLQYGGNILPNITTKEEADRYGRFIGGLIEKVRNLARGAPVIVIGPSDMAIKDGEHYVTRPLLEDVRNAMRENTLEHGAVFWDMYASMGGRGSMVRWVEADPPLAATDYTHFSGTGSKKIGELFHSALIHAYADYTKRRPARAPSRTPKEEPAHVEAPISPAGTGPPEQDMEKTTPKANPLRP